MNEVVRYLAGQAFRRDEGGPARTDIHRLEFLCRLDADAQVLPAGQNVVVDRLDAEHVAQRRVERDLGLVQCARLGQTVSQHEGHLQGSARTLQRGRRKGHHGLPALVAESVHGTPGGRCRLSRWVHAGETVAAYGFQVHAFDKTPVLVRSDGDHQIVVADALPSRGAHGVGSGVELDHHVLDPVDRRGNEISVAVDDLLHRPDAGCHQGVAGLIVVNLFGIDQGDARAVEHVGEPVRHGNAAQAAAGYHDMGLARDPRGPGIGMARQSAGKAGTGQLGKHASPRQTVGGSFGRFGGIRCHGSLLGVILVRV